MGCGRVQHFPPEQLVFLVPMLRVETPFFFKVGIQGCTGHTESGDS